MRPAIKIMRPKKFARTLRKLSIVFRPSRKVIGFMPFACKLDIVQSAKTRNRCARLVGLSDEGHKVEALTLLLHAQLQRTKLRTTKLHRKVEADKFRAPTC